MQVSSIFNCVTDVDPNAKTDGTIRWRVAVISRYLLLDVHGATHRPVNAVEYHEQRVAAGLQNPAAVLPDYQIDQVCA
jgi:hypothetical protein